MNSKRILAVVFALAALAAAPARSETVVRDSADPPALSLAPVPDDPEQFECAFGKPERLELLEKLNRCDRTHLQKLKTIVVPEDWSRPELDFTPLPVALAWASERPKVLLVDKPLQAFAAYEDGRIVRWGPLSSGSQKAPTPSGLYFLNWKSRGRNSTVNGRWFLPWYYNFDNRSGRSFHEYALPGAPASHGCIRLLGRDANWLYDWGESWTLDKRGWNVVINGTPVLILGEYDYAAEPPWRDPGLLRTGFKRFRADGSISSVAKAIAADLIAEPPAPIADGVD